MARVFVTGSADGLGLMAARLLLEQGHAVVLHARSAARARDALAAAPQAEAAVVGDLASAAQTRSVAGQVNQLGRFDAIIHNAGVGYREPHEETEDGLPRVFAVNALAPYILTVLIDKPARLVYLGSGMHLGADPHLEDVAWKKRRWQGAQAYAESKLHDVMLAFAVARRWPGVHANAVDPGWVATRMGGPGAPGDLDKAHRTQAWLAAGDDPKACVSGEYLFHQRRKACHPAARDPDQQDALLAVCRQLSGIAFPAD